MSIISAPFALYCFYTMTDPIFEILDTSVEENRPALAPSPQKRRQKRKAGRNTIWWVLLGMLLLSVIWGFYSSELQPTSFSPELTPATQGTRTRYLKSAANVRSCPSTQCEILGIYPAGTKFTFPGVDTDEERDWEKITWTNQAGVQRTGWIHASLFQDTPPATPQNKSQQIPTAVASPSPETTLPPRPTPQLLSESLTEAEIKRAADATVAVKCLYQSLPDTQGSGIYVQMPNGEKLVITNAHVVSWGSVRPTNCLISFYDISRGVFVGVAFGSIASYRYTEDLDVAFFG